jgi:sortase A
MSVITGRESRVAGPEIPVRSPWKVPDLCREFVENFLVRARTVAGRDRTGLDVPRPDWDSFRGAGDTAPTLEEATGSVVTAAFVAARQIAGGADRLFGGVDSAIQRHPVPAGRDVSIDQCSKEVSFDDPFGGPIGIVDPVEISLFSPSAEAVPDLEDAVVTRGPQTLATPSAGYTAFTWLLNLGAVLLLFVAWQLWGTSISQHHAQAQLHQAFEASLRHSTSKPGASSGPLLIPANQVVTPPAEGTPIAHLQIPAIGLDEYVVSGTAEGDLAKGPGHYIGTAAPGQAGNVAIAGHRTTNGAPFNQLGKLAIGNQIYLTTLTGERLTYLVSQAPNAVSPSDVAVLNDFGDNRVTLTTCNPEYSSSQRLVVVGELQQPNPPKASKAATVDYHIVNPATTSWDWSSLPLVILELGILLLLGLGNRWITAWFGRSGRWIILVPVWAGGLYLLFGTLTSFLPASI